MIESSERTADGSSLEASQTTLPSKSGDSTCETARPTYSTQLTADLFPVLPTDFGQYRIVRILNKGTTGPVYLAYDSKSVRSVVLKVIRSSTAGSAKFIQRMKLGVHAAAKIDHPGAILPIDSGVIDGICYVAFPYVAGEDLRTYLRRVGHLRTAVEATSLTLQMTRILQAAHSQGILHLDLGPVNVVLNHAGEVAIVGFRLAVQPDMRGMIVGTASEMSPEQAMGSCEIDHSSDLYAIGLMLFEMLTGKRPFTGSAIEVLGQKAACEPVSPLSINPDIPPQLAAICHKLIARKKKDRYADCAELIVALQKAATFGPPGLASNMNQSAPGSSEFWCE